MNTSLEQFRQLTRVFDPIYRPYADAADGPGAAYVEAAHADFRKQIEAALLLNDNSKLLLAGQPGCGKTTMLLGLVKWLRDMGRAAVFVDLETQATVQDLGLVEVHIAAAAEVLSSSRGGPRPSESSLRAVSEWLRAAQFFDAASSELDPAALAADLKRLLGAARESADARRTLRGMVRMGGDLDPQVILTRLLEDLSPHRPVLVLDGLDKLAPDQARAFFLDDQQRPLADAPCAAILTIPLSVVYEPRFNVLKERYNNADNAVLPAIRLYDFDRQNLRRERSPAGFSVLRDIVVARLPSKDARVFREGAIERAIEGSGGNLRELARLIQASIVKAYVRSGDKIELFDVEAAIADQRESFRRSYQPRFLPFLKTVRERFVLENADDVGKLLLYGLWVMEYRNGITWYSLPVPVEQLLEDLGGA